MRLISTVVAALALAFASFPASAQRPEVCEVTRNAAHKWERLSRAFEDQAPVCADAVNTAQMCSACAEAYETFQDMEHWLYQHIRCKQMVEAELYATRDMFASVANACGY